MARIPLLSGAYSSRSLIANAQRCVNLYPEAAPQETGPPVPVTHLLTPGLTQQYLPKVGTVRALYRTSIGLLIAVVDDSVYQILAGFAGPFLMGTITGGFTPVSLVDNGITCMIVDGSANGWWFKVAVNGVGTLLDPTVHAMADPAFLGATRVVYLDGYFALNRPGTNQFYLSPPFWDGVVVWDGTQIASKTGGPDPIITLAVINGNLWLLGAFTTEVWFDSGATDFPFERQPGVLIEHGIEAAYSVATTDVEVMWLGRDRDGNGVVYKSEGYAAVRVSNFALENTLVGFADLQNAVGFIYQQEGHTFYQLTITNATSTQVLDLSNGQWHERTWTNGSGVQSRHRANCVAFVEKVFVGDYETGAIYTYDLTNGTDNGGPIVRTRSFPHLVKDGKRISYSSFIADMDVSQAGGSSVSLRWSDDRGATFGAAITLPIVNTQTSLIARRLGMARDRVFELSWTFAAQTSLNGAWVEVEKAET